MPTYIELEVSLIGITPRIWRRFLLPPDATFQDLHEAIQDAGPWDDCHLFAFYDEKMREIAPDDADGSAISTVLGSSGKRCRYVYDFGDDWQHDIVVRRVLEIDEDFERRLVGGERAFPPEDSGGVGGYQILAERGRAGRKAERFDLEAARREFDIPERPRKGRGAKKKAPEAPKAYTYTNQRGATYYLHRSTSKSGSTRYLFKKSIGEDAVAELPEGYEVRENVNGLVSVGRARPPAANAPDVAVVTARLERDLRLRIYRAEARDAAIVVYEPTNLTGIPGFQPPLQYQPVLRFERGDEAGRYVVRRMTYRADGGWSSPVESGPLDELAAKYLPLLGTDAFFEIY